MPCERDLKQSECVGRIREIAKRKVSSEIDISLDFIVFERMCRARIANGDTTSSCNAITHTKNTETVNLRGKRRTKSVIIKIVEIQHLCLQPLDTTYFRSCVPHIYCLRMCLSVC